ncbi:hypothetical protein NDU88_005150 [Pleurodeles waltl]|uniref:Uncharacterized protein n=1 Tax=Pleurodeles waltl TaxID=8319 RepID=A0AAV7WAZ2_PLEWA|nr:hypothetical protein NDU88_005150 [Pleurodeles waltl]
MRWSDPSYPWGTDAMRIPDPEVLRAGTNLLLLPGDGGQEQPLHATARSSKGEGGVPTGVGEFEEEEGKT